MTITELLVRRADLGAIAAASRDAVIADGEVLFRIERFALTANNMTYAAHGTGMKYWDFFPAPEGFGIVPVWGFAVVEQSRANEIAPGQRFYGYWPMASHAVLVPGRISPRGFIDTAAHRLPLPPVYNGYHVASSGFGPETLQALFRPLYTTSFVLDVMLQDSPAQTLVLTSASSKTALGLAQAASGRQRMIGVTSPANRAFVEATGYFDDVIDYDHIDALGNCSRGVALVDFSGNGKVRNDVHSVLGDRLIESHVVGDTHWDAANSTALPGVQPQMFFAPSVIVERIGQWGAEGFEQRLSAAWDGFIASTRWLQIIESTGADAVATHWRALAKGDINPADGLVLTI